MKTFGKEVRKMINRSVSIILGFLSGICGAVALVGYAIPAISIQELTNTNIALWVRLLDAALMWALTIGAFYLSCRLLRVWPKSTVGRETI